MRLRTFGGLSLEPEPGDGPAPSFGPRRLALLAIVAAANANGIPREKILGILWPDVGEEQGRHTLSQTLYSIRRESGAGWITGGAQVRLSGLLRSDVTDFLAALKSDDVERLTALYAGPFLEGFYLGAAPDFERWVDETRSRLHFSALKAIEALARRCDSAGHSPQSVETWRRLTHLEPLKGAYAAGYLNALEGNGDHAGARQFAAEYEARLRGEFELEPDATVAKIISRIRSTPRSPASPPPSLVSSSTWPVASDEGAAGDVASEIGVEAAGRISLAHGSPPPGVAHTAGGAPNGGTRTGRRVAVRAALAGAALVVASLGAAFLSQSGAAKWLNETKAPLLAVGTITAQDTVEHGIVLRNLLATNLARLNGVQVVSNTRLAELTARSSGSSQVTAVAAARQAGASDVFEGEIGVTSGGLALTLRRISVATGVVLQGYTLRADDIFSLTDSASLAIARDFRIDPPADAMTTVRTKSAVAYALYDNGLSALSHSDVASSYELLCAALAQDSTFAMAAAHAWSVAVVLERREDARRLLPIVERLAARTVERERLWIESLVAFHTAAPLAEQLVLIERLTRRFPGDPDGQLLRGRVLFAAGDFAGAVEAYDRAVFIDSATGPIGSYCRVCGAIFMMTDVYIWWDSLAAAERSARRLSHLRYKGRAETGGLVEVLLRQGRRREAEGFAASVRASRPGDVMDFSGSFNRDLIRSGRLAEMEASLLAALQTALPSSDGENPWLLMFTLRNQGRLDEAYLLAAEGVVPSINLRLPEFFDPLSTAVVALEKGDSKEAASRFMAMVAEMRSQGYDPVVPPWARQMAFRMTLAGMALAAAGDTGTVRALADSIKVIGPNSNWARELRIHHFLEGLLYQQQNRHAEAVDVFRKAVFSYTDGFTRINMEMARSLLALNRSAEAIAVLRPALRGGVDGGNTYVTHTELHELLAHAFYAAGQRDSAAVHYRAVETAWRRADPRFAARYGVAKARAYPLLNPQLPERH